jgi:hypothetical protein
MESVRIKIEILNRMKEEEVLQLRGGFQRR